MDVAGVRLLPLPQAEIVRRSLAVGLALSAGYLLSVALFRRPWPHPALIVFLLAVLVAGVLLWRGTRLGVQVGVAAYALQGLIAINEHFTWVVQLPAFIGPALNGSTLGPRVSLLPFVSFAGVTDPESIVVGFNAFAIGAACYLGSLLISAKAAPPKPDAT
jgi:hypothetical protein